MDSKKIELRKLLFRHNSEANNLLRSDYNNLGTALIRYLNFIDNQPITKAFVKDCVSNYLPDDFDVDTELNEVISSPRSIFVFPPSCEGECAAVYLILKALVDKGSFQSMNLLLGYAHGSKRYDDMVEGFVDDVARRLVNGVSQAITLKGIELGLDESVTQVNHFGNSGAAIASQTMGGSNTNISQINGIDRDVFNAIIG